jgi:hypothetical protein
MEMVPLAPGPSSESRQGTNPREMERGRCPALGVGRIAMGFRASDVASGGRQRQVLRVDAAAERGHRRSILTLARRI